jgi:hypothetical protein
MDIRDQFFSVAVPETAIAAMGRTLGAVGIFGLKEWFDSLDHEFVLDLVSAYQLWVDQQTPRRPEVPVPPPDSTVPFPANGRRLKIRFKGPRFRRSRA